MFAPLVPLVLALWVHQTEFQLATAAADSQSIEKSNSKWDDRNFFNAVDLAADVDDSGTYGCGCVASVAGLCFYTPDGDRTHRAYYTCFNNQTVSGIVQINLKNDKSVDLGSIDGCDFEGSGLFTQPENTAGTLCNPTAEKRRSMVRLECLAGQPRTGTTTETSTCIYETIIRSDEFCSDSTTLLESQCGSFTGGNDPTIFPSLEPTTAAPSSLSPTTHGPTPTGSPTAKPAPSERKQKHIVMIITDDQGYNDIGYRDRAFSTPYLDTLAATGIQLPHFYTMTTCSPTRAALLTGLEVNKMGVSGGAFIIAEDRALPLEYTLLPGILKAKQGYRTVGIGKWHLGSRTKELLPTRRGFDHYFGMTQGYGDHFSYRAGVGCVDRTPTTTDGNSSIPNLLPPILNPNCTVLFGYDLFEDERPVPEYQVGAKYATELLGEKAVQKIMQHEDPDNVPLFLYFAPTAPHTPLQVPLQYLDRCVDATTTSTASAATASKVENGRQLICGMMAAVDDQIGNIMAALEAKGMLEDTVFLYQSDNGGVVDYGSDNGPFRSQKGSFYEGGVRVPAFISGAPVLGGSTYEDIVFVTDFHATMLEIAGISDAVTDGTSLLSRVGTSSLGLNPQYDRESVKLAVRGSLYFFNSFAVVYRYAETLWKYTFLADTLLIGAELTPSEGTTMLPELYDLTNDPSESVNTLITTTTSTLFLPRSIAAARARGVELIQEIANTTVVALEDTAGGIYIRNANGPSARGCWFPPGLPGSDVECNVRVVPFPMEDEEDEYLRPLP